MAVLTIRNLDDRVKARLRARAGQEGVSMEEEARRILTAALGGPPPAKQVPLGRAMTALFRSAAVDHLPISERSDRATGADLR